MEDVTAEGDKVVHWMRRGTHTGDFVTPAMHLPATSKQVTVIGITIFRLSNEKLPREEANNKQQSKHNQTDQQNGKERRMTTLLRLRISSLACRC